MITLHQFGINLSLTDAAATNNNSSITGIAAGGAFYRALTGADTTTNVGTAIVVGDGVATINPAASVRKAPNVIANLIKIRLTDAPVVAGRPHVLKLTKGNLRVGEYENILSWTDPMLLDLTTTTKRRALGCLVSYNEGQEAMYISLAQAAIATYVGNELSFIYYYSPTIG